MKNKPSIKKPATKKTAAKKLAAKKTATKKPATKEPNDEMEVEETPIAVNETVEVKIIFEEKLRKVHPKLRGIVTSELGKHGKNFSISYAGNRALAATTDGKTAGKILKITSFGKNIENHKFKFETRVVTPEERVQKRKISNQKKSAAKRQKMEENGGASELRFQLEKERAENRRLIRENERKNVQITILEGKIEDTTGQEVQYSRTEKKLIQRKE